MASQFQYLEKVTTKKFKSENLNEGEAYKFYDAISIYLKLYT